MINYLQEQPKYLVTVLAVFEKLQFFSKNFVGYFWATFDKMGYFLGNF